MYLGIAIFAAVAIAEIVLASKWNPFYCTVGLPIFSRRVERREGLAGLSLDDLDRGSRTAAAAGFAFRQLDANTVAFREPSAQYISVMRGVIRHRPGESGVVVQGLLNWFVVALVVVLAVGLRGNISIFLPGLAIALAVLYFIQGVRFWRIASSLDRTLPLRQHTGTIEGPPAGGHGPRR